MQQSPSEKSQDLSNELRIFNISTKGYKEIELAGLNLDQLFILESHYHEITNNIGYFAGTIKGLANIQSLVRKGYLGEDNKITLTGIAILTSIRDDTPFQPKVKEKKAEILDGFDFWWKAYPTSDIFEYKGKKFEGQRSFRVKKDDCRRKFLQILNEGEYTVEDLIRALEYEVLAKKEASLRERENKMKYMQNSLTYLNQRTFEGFIEISKQKLQTIQRGGVDI